MLGVFNSDWIAPMPIGKHSAEKPINNDDEPWVHVISGTQS